MTVLLLSANTTHGCTGWKARVLTCASGRLVTHTTCSLTLLAPRRTRWPHLRPDVLERLVLKRGHRAGARAGYGWRSLGALARSALMPPTARAVSGRRPRPGGGGCPRGHTVRACERGEARGSPRGARGAAPGAWAAAPGSVRGRGRGGGGGGGVGAAAGRRARRWSGDREGGGV